MYNLFAKNSVCLCNTFETETWNCFLTNGVFPTQIREITCIYLNRYMRELYRNMSKSTIEHICVIVFLPKTQNNINWYPWGYFGNGIVHLLFVYFWGYSFSTVYTSLFWLECQAVSIVLEENRVWFSFKTYMLANYIETK